MALAFLETQVELNKNMIDPRPVLLEQDMLN